jgi:hypothetical protein
MLYKSHLNFLIVGASRSGTSTLHHILRNSTYVYMPENKELQFFNDDRRFNLGQEWYEKQIGKFNKNIISGEASPPYFHRGILLDCKGQHRWSEEDDAPARAASMLPDAKIIISLRNPVERAQSQFWKNVWQGREKAKNFDQAVAEELAGKRSPQQTPLCWLYKNAYSMHVSRWLELFGHDRVLLLVFEEWTREPDKSMQQLEQFLDLPTGCLPREVKAVDHRNSGRRLLPGMRLVSRLGRRVSLVRSFIRRFGTRSGYPKVSPQTTQSLQEYFRRDVEHLEQITGRNFSIWGFDK